MYDEKRVLIYGVGKFQMDFQSIFDDIQVEYYISDDNEKGEMFGKPVRTPDCLANEDRQDLMVIVCEFDYEKKKQMLLKKGLKDDQIIYAEDLFPLLDTFQKDVDNEAVVVYGGGKCKQGIYIQLSENMGKRAECCVFYRFRHKERWDNLYGKAGQTFSKMAG